MRFALFVGLLGCIAVVMVLRNGSEAVRTRTTRVEIRRGEAGEATPVHTNLTPETRAELTHELQISQIEKNGELGVYIQPLEGGPAYQYGPLQSGQTWSVIKVPLVLAYLRWRAEVTGKRDGSKALTPYARTEVQQTIRQSDNRAARHLYNQMSARYGLTGADARIERIFQDAGETGIRIPKTGLHAFGATVWRLSDAVKLFRALNDGELASHRDTAYLLKLMRTVSYQDSWGLKQAYGPDSRVAFKGGWGPSRAQYDLEQAGIVGGPNAGYVIAIMFHTNGRSPIRDAFAAGRSMFNAVAAIIAEQFPAGASRG